MFRQTSGRELSENIIVEKKHTVSVVEKASAEKRSHLRTKEKRFMVRTRLVVAAEFRETSTSEVGCSLTRCDRETHRFNYTNDLGREGGREGDIIVLLDGWAGRTDAGELSSRMNSGIVSSRVERGLLRSRVLYVA